MTRTPGPLIDRLVRSDEPWTAYRALTDLAKRSEDDPQVVSARKRLLDHPLIRDVIGRLRAWPGVVLNSRKSAFQPFHLLAFLAEAGVRAVDPPMPDIVTAALAVCGDDGIVRLPMPPDEDGKPRSAWALCDAPVTLRALAMMGLEDEPCVRGAARRLAALGRENGWPCRLSPEAGSWHGPGKTSDPCPYATLAMLRLCALYEDLREGTQARAGAETLLTLWHESRTAHPYQFHMGTDFRKLKVPFIWYDILHVAEALSRFAFAWQDPRFLDMIALVASKADGNGMFAPEADWKPWADSGLAHKGTISDWMTVLVRRLLDRIDAER